LTSHISARLAWHDSGWNGRICRNPKANTYCVGQYSFPGDVIANHRDLQWEESACGQMCDAEHVPPCCYSINAFGTTPVTARTDPPSWFRDGTKGRTRTMPPATIATWPYEEMYKDEVRNPENTYPRYDPDRRHEAVNAYFAQVQEGRSLIFYYVNYSNPFSENDQRYYVVVGMSRVKKVGEELTWVNQGEQTRRQYGNYIWARNITSNYPDEGLRIPYEAYMNRPEALERILFVPDNPRLFKYATRLFSDDDALGLVERFQQIVGALQDLGDRHEDWAVRQAWLASLEAELWTGRGLYPGLLRVLEYLKFSEAIPYARRQIPASGEQVVKDGLFALLEARTDAVDGLALSAARREEVRKRWRLLPPQKQRLLAEVLPRFDLQAAQIAAILDKPESVSIRATPEEIELNPYVLAEQYVGMDLDDNITFSKIDHGMLPSPELGAPLSIQADDARRLRALCVEQLQRARQQTFLPADQVLEGVNHKLSFMPEWKRADFHERYLEVERQALAPALHFYTQDGQLYLYLRRSFEDERLIEQVLRQLAGRPDIRLRSPVREGDWREFLFESGSDLAREHRQAYEEAIAGQVAVCQKVFLRPVSVIAGAAGTGKTTVVSAIIKAIEKGHGAGTSFRLLAPTGKAADRLRDKTGKDASTLHSFLAERGWLNDNLTFKENGRREESITTYILDESSMLDLSLLATFFRAVNWNAVQRLIFVGDPNQLPPIGVGRPFADLIDWLKKDHPESVAHLSVNMRQLETRLKGKNTVLLDLACLYERCDLQEAKTAAQDAEVDTLLDRLLEGGDVADDLRVLYWRDPDELQATLLNAIIADMERDTGITYDPQRPYELWKAALKDRNGQQDAETFQVLSPYRGELYGVEHLNAVLQQHKNHWLLETKGHLGGITYFDKVIQVRNRTRSQPISAYDAAGRKRVSVEVYNGEIGMTQVHGFDRDKWNKPYFHLEKFQVVFARKPHLWVNYESPSQVEGDLELAYAITTHKAQGSEFNRVYFVIPKARRALMSRELFYTGLTRARVHCTLLIEEDISPLLSLRRRERSALDQVNSSLFRFHAVPPEYRRMHDWYEEGKIHRTLTEEMVRSKSEVIIANMLFERNIPFLYEVPLYAPDGTFVLPDFTLSVQGETWYWEHLGMLDEPRYREHWEKKRAWYERHGFADRLIITTETEGFDSIAVKEVFRRTFGIE